MAAAKGAAKFIGLSGRSYVKQFNLDDTAGHPATWDYGAGASTTSPLFLQLPEPTTLVDVIIAAATTQTQTSIQRGGVSTGDMLLNSIQLASIATRPALAIPFAANQTITFNQVA